MPDLNRTQVTFEQAEGVEPLPTQLKPKELTPALRAGLWHVLHQHLARARQFNENAPPTLRDQWLQMLYDRHVWKLHRPADEFRAIAKENSDALKHVILGSSRIRVGEWGAS